MIRYGVLVALLASCSADRAGWARRGSFFKLHESATLQVRRGPQKLDPASGEIAIAWVGARAPAGSPPLLGCELCVFDDRDGDRRPDPGEILTSRESLARSGKILFDDVRARPGPGACLRVRFTVRTEDEQCDVGWVLDPD